MERAVAIPFDEKWQVETALEDQVIVPLESVPALGRAGARGFEQGENQPKF
jgi:hypothetical protein